MSGVAPGPGPGARGLLRQADGARKEEIRLLSPELRSVARDDPDVRLLMTVPGVGYYIALLVKTRDGDASRFSSGDHLASYACARAATLQEYKNCTDSLRHISLFFRTRAHTQPLSGDAPHPTRAREESPF